MFDNGNGKKRNVASEQNFKHTHSQHTLAGGDNRNVGGGVIGVRGPVLGEGGGEGEDPGHGHSDLHLADAALNL